MGEFGEEGREGQHPFKRVQTYIPDFRGYSRREDLKDADRMIRMVLSQKLTLARKHLEESVRILENALLYEDMEFLVSLLSALKRIESEVAYAESGFSWLARDISLGEEELERLYELDAQLLDIATLILRKSEETKSASSAGNRPNLKSNFVDMRTKLTMLEDTFRKRMLSLNRLE
jgi:hypothetical protein